MNWHHHHHRRQHRLGKQQFDKSSALLIAKSDSSGNSHDSITRGLINCQHVSFIRCSYTCHTFSLRGSDHSLPQQIGTSCHSPPHSSRRQPWRRLVCNSMRERARTQIALVRACTKFMFSTPSVRLEAFVDLQQDVRQVFAFVSDWMLLDS